MTKFSFKIYSIYKPLRNKLRKCTLHEGLLMCWIMSNDYFTPDLKLYEKFGINISEEYLARRNESPAYEIHAFQIENIIIELLIHADGWKKLTDWEQFYSVYGKYHTFWDTVTGMEIGFLKGLAQQFYFQDGSPYGSPSRYDYTNPMTFAYILYNHESVSDYFQKAFGMTKEKYFQIFLAIWAHITVSIGFFSFDLVIQDIDNISETEVLKFLDLFSKDINWYKLQNSKAEKDIFYTYRTSYFRNNPIIKHNNFYYIPLVHNYILTFMKKTHILIRNNLTSEKDKGTFNRLIGKRFEECITKILDFEKIDFISEKPYGEKYSVDFFIEKDSSILFLDAKLMEPVEGFFIDDPADTDRVVEELIKIYKQLDQYITGKYPKIYPRFQQQHIFPILVSPFEWWMNDIKIKNQIDFKIKQQTSLLYPNIVSKFPWEIMSLTDFQYLIFLITNGIPINTIFKERFSDQYRPYKFELFLKEKFSTSTKYLGLHRYFNKEFEEFMSLLKKES